MNQVKYFEFLILFIPIGWFKSSVKKHKKK